MTDQASVKKIMVVEDEVLLLEAITKKLQLNNVEVMSCTGGAQALEALKNATSLPVIIWLDYYLKDMNGIEFMNKLKDNPEWAKIPVVVVSNSAGESSVHNMLALGASKYIVKADYRLDQIINMIDEVVRN